MNVFDPLSTPSSFWHPEYQSLWTDWKKWRLAFYGGRPFIDEYLEKLSARETDDDYIKRKGKTYNPAFAKAGVQKIINRISARFGAISRKSSSKSYVDGCLGINGGVDNSGSSMNYFMGGQVLPELLVMGKVAVYIDMPPLEGIDLFSQQGKRPYLYTYTREQIVNWHQDYQGNIESILLMEYVYEFDKTYGVPVKYITQYRHYYKKPDDTGFYRVYYQLLDDNFKAKQDLQILNLTEIPIALMQISNSLMEDVADYQIAMMNMASTDVSYVVKSGFPFYVEAYDMMAEAQMDNMQRGFEDLDANGNSIGGTETVANTAKNKEIIVGSTKGRRVPKGLEFPQFINPSAEPLTASIAKQKQMKDEINELLDLAVSNIQSGANYKDMMARPPSGVQHIGLELEAGERKILRLWQEYENNKNGAAVNYPTDYYLLPFADRVTEANSITEVIPKIPSNTFRREMAKKAVLTLLGGTVDLDIISKINSEIDAAAAIVPDPKTVSSDIEQGLCSAELGSDLRGYPDGEPEKAAEEHAARLARIAMAQGGPNSAPMGARGINDLSGGAAKEAKTEKQVSQSGVTHDKGSKKVRGEGG